MTTTLLAVDDSKTMRKVLEITFAGEDYRTVLAESSGEALTKLRAESPALALVDAQLGAESGYDLCQRLKREAPNVPVIILSSKQQPYDRARGASVGADDFMDKPFDTQQLIDKVAAVLRRPTAPAARPQAAAPSAARPAAQPAPSPAFGRAPSPSPATGPGGGPGGGAAAPGFGRGPAQPGARPSAAQPLPQHGRSMPQGRAMPTPSAGTPAARGTSPGTPSAAGLHPSVRQQPAVRPPSAPHAAVRPPSAPMASPGPIAQPRPQPPAPAPAAAAIPGVVPAHPAAAAAVTTTAAVTTVALEGSFEKKLAAMGLNPEQITGVLALSREVVEKVVWEVVPVLAETLIKEEIKRLTAS